MNKSELYSFVKEKRDKATPEQEYLSGLNLTINGEYTELMTWEGQVFEEEKIAYFTDIEYSNPQLRIYHDNGMTYFEYDELIELFDNGNAEFLIIPNWKL